MNRPAIAVWTVAVVFVVLIGIWVAHERRVRDEACARPGESAACVQAKKSEDGAILMGVLGTVVLVVFGGVAMAMVRR